MKRFLITTTVITLGILSCKKDKDKAPPTAPLVKTAAITNNGGGNITTGGSIVSDNGAAVTKSGIAWSQGHSTPSITDSVVESTTTTGAFTVNINGIDFGKTYYFRAYATNSAGTGYGDVVSITTSNDSVRFTYNGQSVTYGIIISPTTGKKWLDRNIGAKRLATAPDDYQAYGDLFQWGRPADGHQLITWTSSTIGTPVNGITSVLATSDVPGNSGFITVTANPADWRDDNNRNRWATTPQGPCPAGWHVPRQNEWAAEISTAGGGSGTATTGGMIDLKTAYSQLKLTIAGYRRSYASGSDTAGILKRPGTYGYYWSADDTNNGAYWVGVNLTFGDTFADLQSSVKSTGYSVRCIKDN